MKTAFASFQTFARSHDDLIAFHATFLVLSFLAAALLNLGFFALLIIAHMALDLAKYYDQHAEWRLAIKSVLHENLLDISLLMVALVISVYLHHSVVIVAVSGLAKVEVSFVRFVASLLPRVAILRHIVTIFSQFHAHVGSLQLKGFVWIDRIYLGCVATCLLLLVFAAPIMGVEASVVRWVILWELVPWYV